MQCRAAEPGEGHDSLYECIYCRSRREQDAFNREHVLSEAFGHFKGALVLHQFVCRDCNRLFANGIERQLTRDAFEAIPRYLKGLKEPKLGPIKPAYVEFAVPEGSASSGLRLHLAGAADTVEFRPAAQVAALDEATDRWRHLTADEIDSGLLDRYPHFKRKGARLRVFAATPEEHNLLVAKLTEHGIKYAQDGELQTPADVLGPLGSSVEVTFTVNMNVLRCIAKYALNYLACVCNSRFALATEFDSIREFARYGKMPDRGMVRTHLNPILAGDEPEKRQTHGHLVTMNWDDTLQILTCRVSIFNYITYDVELCRALKSALWRPIRSGHHYDLTDMAVKPLMGVPTRLTV